MKRISAMIVALTFVISVRAITIETVPVGNAGNVGQTQPHGIFGAVGYPYRIATYEVTNSQYSSFLNAVDPLGTNSLALYNNSMMIDARGGINFNPGAGNGSKFSVKVGYQNYPVVYASWYDAVRFANWLHNGQVNGGTESGAYNLVGGTPTPSNGLQITRNPEAKWFLPSEDEWYKAAYHKNDGATANYWIYPTATDSVPFSDQPPGNDAPNPSNTANFSKTDGIDNGYDDFFAVTGSDVLNDTTNYLTKVGAYTRSIGPYATFDQGGNVWEWNEAAVFGDSRRFRGGSWFSNSIASSSALGYIAPTDSNADLGFRVASVAIPEPTTLLLGIAIIAAFPSRRRGLKALGR